VNGAFKDITGEPIGKETDFRSGGVVAITVTREGGMIGFVHRQHGGVFDEDTLECICVRLDANTLCSLFDEFEKNTQEKRGGRFIDSLVNSLAAERFILVLPKSCGNVIEGVVSTQNCLYEGEEKTLSREVGRLSSDELGFSCDGFEFVDTGKRACCR